MDEDKVIATNGKEKTTTKKKEKVEEAI